MRRWPLIILAALTACGAPVASGTGGDGTTTTQATHKVFVCKYVGTPGVDERLQTGDNPISVDTNSLRNFVSVGSFFNDEQGRSIAIAFDTGQPEPGVDQCPRPQTPTTTSTSVASSTSTSTSVAATTTTCPDCVPNTQGVTTTTGVTTSTGATTTTLPASTTTGPTTTGGSTTTSTGPTTTQPGVTTTTLPPTFSFSGASTVCIREVPTIRITFGNALPQLAGQTGTLTMTAVNGGALLSTQPLVYAPGTTVDLLYPGTRVNADGTIADVPGWNLNAAGFWVRDPADEFLRDGILLTYTLNPTATATVTYPPESAACANPDGPFPPGPPPANPRPPAAPPAQPGLPPTL